MKTQHSSPLAGLGLVAALVLAAPLPAAAAVSVYGLATSTGDRITVRTFANITGDPIVSHTARLHYNPSLLRVVSASRNDAAWYFSDGTRRAPQPDPDASQPGTILFQGAKFDAVNPWAGVSGQGVLLGTAVFQRLDRATPEFDLTLGRPGSFASFVTILGVTLEAQQGRVTFSRVAPDQNDVDLDGLSDSWEIKWFKDIQVAYYADDADEDGIDNRGEEALGSDPTDARSNLQMRIVRLQGDLFLEWDSHEDRTYAVEAGSGPGKFETLEAGIKATPPRNLHPVKATQGEGAVFYRVRLEDGDR